MAILSIDQGTSATKALVVEGDAVLATAEAQVQVSATSDGGVEVDPEALWRSVLGASERALVAAGKPSLEAIGLANQGETIVAWDRATGAPLGPAIVWQDRRSSTVCAQVGAHAARLAEITGLELDPYFVAPKIAWWRAQPSHIGSKATVTTTDTWLLHRLCGAYVTDVATAGRSLLLDLDRGSWSGEACDVFDIDPQTLPDVIGNAQPVGDCDLFGPTAVPVTGACVDQQAALFAEGCRRAGEAKCTYGTGAFLLASTGTTPTRSHNGLVSCPAWSVGGQLTWCLDGQVYTVGAAVSWLIDMGIIDEPADLDRLGGEVPDAGGTTFVPALAGLAAPYWRPQAKAAFTGLSLATTRAHLVRAAIDGIAAQVALLAQAAGRDLGTPLTTLRVDGGLTRSRTLLQVQADLLQATVEVYPSPHATAWGVAELAAIGVGHRNAADAGRSWVPESVVEPRIGDDEAAARLAVWKDVATATMDR